MSGLKDALLLIEDSAAPHVGAILVDKQATLASAGESSHVFALASVTKLFTATCVLIAVEEGTLQLRDALGPPGSTVAHVLAHASGLSRNDAGVVAAPVAERRIYSNAGFELLGQYLAERAAMSFSQYLSLALLEPLAMTKTSFAGSPAYGASSSPEDLARFARELLSPTLFSPASLERFCEVAFPGLGGVLPGFGRMRPCDWGLGFELKDAKSPHWTGAANAPTTYGHFGQAGSCLWIDPHAGLGLVLCSDRPFGSWAAALWPKISDAVLAARDSG